MSLRTKFFLLSAGIVAVVLVAVYLLVRQRVHAAACAGARQELDAIATAVERLEAESRRLLLLRAEGLARAPEVAELTAGAAAEGDDLARSLLESRGDGADLLVVATAERHWLAAADAAPAQEVEAALAAAPHPLARGGQGAVGVWLLGGHLYRVAAVPVAAAHVPEAAGSGPHPALLLLTHIADAELDRLKALTQSEVAVLVDGRALGSTLPEELTPGLTDLSAGVASGDDELRLGGEAYLARLHPFRLDYGAGNGQRLILRSLATSRRLAADLSDDLRWLGLTALALALLAAWIGARGLTAPLRRSAEAMSEMARSGRLGGDLQLRGNGPEVRLFHRAVHRLITSLETTERQREGSYVEAVGAVVVAIDARDNETTGHSFRVARYAVVLGEHMGLPARQLQDLEWGALLHDIGKIAVPDAVLRKAGPLTDEEWHIMRQHPNWGVEILGDVQFLEPALEVVANHQERWDGSGYPQGLMGPEIPLSARIFAVVDAYDAITSDRPYRHARPHAVAVEELRRVAGAQLDPEVVEAFLTIPEATLQGLRQHLTREEVELPAPPAAPAPGGLPHSEPPPVAS